MNPQTNTGTGLLMLVVGFWVLMRSVNADVTGRTLIDHILGRQPSNSVALGKIVIGNVQNAVTAAGASAGQAILATGGGNSTAVAVGVGRGIGSAVKQTATGALP